MTRTLLAIATLAVAACGPMVVQPNDSGSDTSTTDATSDSNVLPDSNTTDSGPQFDDVIFVSPDASVCSTIALTGPDVGATVVAGAPPAFTGGTITAGTYDLTAARLYTTAPDGGTPPGTVRGALGITGNQLELVESFGSSTISAAGTFTTSGSTLTVTPTCPSSSPPNSTSYTATATEVQILQGGSQNTVLVFTHR